MTPDKETLRSPVSCTNTNTTRPKQRPLCLSSLLPSCPLPAERTAACPDYLRDLTAKDRGLIGLWDDEFEPVSWDEARDIIRKAPLREKSELQLTQEAKSVNATTLKLGNRARVEAQLDSVLLV